MATGLPKVVTLAESWAPDRREKSWLPAFAGMTEKVKAEKLYDRAQQKRGATACYSHRPPFFVVSSACFPVHLKGAESA